jgi:hypothetical protein
MARPCKKQEERRGNVVKAYIDDELYSKLDSYMKKKSYPSISQTLIVIITNNFKKRSKNA